MIATAGLRHSSALLPCTAGYVGDNPYVVNCQLRQAVFWSAVLAAVAFLGCAVVGGLLWRVARRERVVATSCGADVDLGADGFSIVGKKDVEGEAEWSERVRRFGAGELE